eukprot:s2149_g6.t2
MTTHGIWTGPTLDMFFHSAECLMLVWFNFHRCSHWLVRVFGQKVAGCPQETHESWRGCDENLRGRLFNLTLARTIGSDSQVVACSGQFLVARPVLLQDLELCYAGFCARNGIPMERVDGNGYEIVMVERFFHVISGFRAPFPVPLERKAVATESHRQSLVLVENPASCAIVPEAPVKLSNPDLPQEKHASRQRSTSKMSTAQASVKSMEQPLLMASASEADEEEKDMEQKLRIVVPHRQAMKIPMNVFWRPQAFSTRPMVKLPI